MLYFYDPINNVKQETTYELAQGITGKTLSNLRSIKSRKLKIDNINCYLIDDKATKKELLLLMMKEHLSDEIWKEVQGSNGEYFISSYGRCKRLYPISNKYRLLMPCIKKNGYQHVGVVINGTYKQLPIHRLVAIHFINNSKNYSAVYHKDENKYNNRANNLKWISKEELGKITGKKASSKPVKKISISTGEILDEYKSITDAANKNPISTKTIQLCINGKFKLGKGFKWDLDTDFQV